MHILLATTQVPFIQGGAEIHARSLLAAFLEAGHRAEIVSIPFKWYPPERILDTMLACRLLDLSEANGRKVDRLVGLKFPAYLIPHPEKVLWILHQHRQAYEQWDHPLGDMALYGNGREVRDAIRRADTQIIPEARAVYTNSFNVSRRLKEYCGLESEPLYHPPQHADAFYCERDDGYFFYPSRINASKRQHLAVEALATLKGDDRLVICGESEDERYFDKLKADIERLGVGSRVQLLGRVTEAEKLALYARCRAVIYPPFDEDYGYVTLEAMLSGKPVVTCMDSGGPLEFVTDGATGCVTAPEGAALGDALARLSADPARAAAMGRQGGEAYLARNINWNAVVEALLA